MEKSKFDKTSLDIPIILYKTKNKRKIEKKKTIKNSQVFSDYVLTCSNISGNAL